MYIRVELSGKGEGMNSILIPSNLTLHLHLGRHCCLWCHITQQELAVPRDIRGLKSCRTLATLHSDWQGFKQAGANLKHAKDYNNVIARPFFEIPLHQVMHALAVHSHSRCFRTCIACHSFDLHKCRLPSQLCTSV